MGLETMAVTKRTANKFRVMQRAKESMTIDVNAVLYVSLELWAELRLKGKTNRRIEMETETWAYLSVFASFQLCEILCVITRFQVRFPMSSC